MPEESIVVRPPEFEKVLEELHVVKLSGYLKNEIQARRDLEEIYQRLLQDVTDLEGRLETGLQDVERAQEKAKLATTDRAAALAKQVSLERRLTRVKVACCLLAAGITALIIIAWDDVTALVLGLLTRFFT